MSGRKILTNDSSCRCLHGIGETVCVHTMNGCGRVDERLSSTARTRSEALTVDTKTRSRDGTVSAAAAASAAVPVCGASDHSGWRENAR